MSVPARLMCGVITATCLAVVACGAQAQSLPADGDSALARLNVSPRHGEWVRVDAGGGDSVMAWVVYPERQGRAPVVVVIHEIYGLTDWIRGVADQLAAEGFIAIAPDLLSGKGANGTGTPADRQEAVRLVRALAPDEVARRLASAATYATRLPAARDRVASIGFCWGGSTSFAFATNFASLRGAVVYYGTAPDSTALPRINGPVLGLYGGDDARVTATVEPTRGAMSLLNKRYDPRVYDGAGHGFLRDQAGRAGANRRAAEQAWPATVAFLRDALGR
ncbi:MAG: dienelactone hydrolase family protein [Gemmatimonadales bacterium]|nr:dienelactone hydrolase family protein [Gemmatimonadales bacterium]